MDMSTVPLDDLKPREDVQLRCGGRIFAMRDRCDNSIEVVYEDKDGGVASCVANRDGRARWYAHPSDYDVVPVPKKHKIEFTVYVYRDSKDDLFISTLLSHHREAPVNTRDAIACLHFEHEFLEGEGLPAG